jgi:uncharacterized membrane protein
MRIFISLSIIVLGWSAAIASPKIETENNSRNFITSKSNMSSKVAAGEVFGACVYVQNGALTCDKIIKSECDDKKGKWIEGGECPPK